MKTSRRCHVHRRVTVMHPVETPEHRHHMVGAMPAVHPGIEHQQCRYRFDNRIQRQKGEQTVSTAPRPLRHCRRRDADCERQHCCIRQREGEVSPRVGPPVCAFLKWAFRLPKPEKCQQESWQCFSQHLGVFQIHNGG